MSFSLILLLYTQFLTNYKIFLADTIAQVNPLLSVQQKLLLLLVMEPHIVDPKKLIFIYNFSSSSFSCSILHIKYF